MGVLGACVSDRHSSDSYHAVATRVSLTIGALVTLGFDPYFAARVICLLSFALFPVPIYALSRFLLSPGRALICTGVVIALSRS